MKALDDLVGKLFGADWSGRKKGLEGTGKNAGRKENSPNTRTEQGREKCQPRLSESGNGEWDLDPDHTDILREKKRKEVRGNNRSVMPFDILGRTRATMKGKKSVLKENKNLGCSNVFLIVICLS